MKTGDSTGVPSGHGLRVVWRGIIVIGCFVAGGVGAALLIDSCLPFPPVPGIDTRLQYFAERKDEFDTIFIGSSRIRFQIIPQEFDNVTAAHGVPTHSFNLGYSGMWPPESYYYLRQVLALHPRRLRWVIIELMDYRFTQVDHEPATMRTAYWHDWQHTGMALRLVAESPLPAIEKLRLFSGHAHLFWQRLIDLGHGAALLQAYFPSRKKPDAIHVDRGGFDPEEKGEWSESARANYAQQIRAFEQAGTNGRVRPGFAAALREIMDDVRRAGAEPIFILPPTVRVEERLAAGLPPGTFWEFDDPARYPRLYLPELHFDPGHLNEAGAREFTGLLAQRLVELARKR